MCKSKQIRIEEYRSLQEEHRRNRSYVFERPIIILGIVAIAMQYFYESTIGIFVLAFLIFLLCFNLWFTGNRLRSDARIIAYIQLIHEGELRTKWFGWENALREYRLWVTHHTKTGDLEQLLSKNLDPETIPTSSRFYPAIWLLHVILVLSIFIISLMKWFLPKTIQNILEVVPSLAATIVFIFYAFGSLRPTKLNTGIELERATWICVFEESSSQAIEA